MGKGLQREPMDERKDAGYERFPSFLSHFQLWHISVIADPLTLKHADDHHPPDHKRSSPHHAPPTAHAHQQRHRARQSGAETPPPAPRLRSCSPPSSPNSPAPPHICPIIHERHSQRPPGPVPCLHFQNSLLHGGALAEVEMQWFFQMTPPSVHSMVLT